MIQRIQTLYLLLSAILLVIMMFFPYATAVTAEGVEYALSFKGFIPSDSTAWQWTLTTAWLSVINIVIPAISLITVNLYRRRMLQIRMSVFNIVLMLGFYGLFFVVKYMLTSAYSITLFSLNLTFVIPFIAAILTYLAIRAIGKDEALMRSLDRIR